MPGDGWSEPCCPGGEVSLRENLGLKERLISKIDK